MDLDYKDSLFYGTDIQVNDKITIHQLLRIYATIRVVINCPVRLVILR